jgi:hypothetical protein
MPFKKQQKKYKNNRDARAAGPRASVSLATNADPVAGLFLSA